MLPQHAAVQHVTDMARAATADARRRIEAVLGPEADADALGTGLFRRGRVAVHFHPDRLVADGLTVAGGLLRDGVYLSQFVTGVSAGGLTAFPGGARDRWEAAMFGGAHQRPGVRPGDRPVYGALDLLGHADGPSPRFGSCRLRLRPHVLSGRRSASATATGSPPTAAPRRLRCPSWLGCAGARLGASRRGRRRARGGPFVPRHGGRA